MGQSLGTVSISSHPRSQAQGLSSSQPLWGTDLVWQHFPVPQCSLEQTFPAQLGSRSQDFTVEGSAGIYP